MMTTENRRSDLSYCPKAVAKEFSKRIDRAGYAEMKALERRLQEHYEAGTLTQKDFARLNARVMQELARSECL